MSHVAFNQLYIDSHVSIFRNSCSELVDQVHEYITMVMMTIIDKQLQHKYPPLLDATKIVVKDFLRKQKEELNVVIERLIDSELFIFTQNPDYPIKVTSVNEPDSAKFLQKTLKIYSDIAIGRFCDYVPMQCHLFFVTRLYKHLHEFVDLEKMSSYLVDDTKVITKRKETETSMKRFENALKVLEKLR